MPYEKSYQKRLPLLARAARRVLAWYDFAEPINAAGGRKRRPPRIEFHGEEGATQLSPRRRLEGVDLARNMERNDSATHGLVRQLRVNVVGDAGKLIFSESGAWYDDAAAYFKRWGRHADFVDGSSWRECLQLAVYALAMEGDFVVMFDEGQLTRKRDEDGRPVLGSGRLLFFEADQVCNLADADFQKWKGDGPRRRWTQVSGILLDGYGRRAGVVISKHRGRMETELKDAFVLTCDPADPDSANWRFVGRKFRLRQLRGTADAIPALTTTQDAAEMQQYELQTAKRAASHYAFVRLKTPEVAAEDVSALPCPAALAENAGTDATDAGNAAAAQAAANIPGATDDPPDAGAPVNLSRITGGQLDASDQVEGIDWDPAARPSGAVTDFLEYSTRLAGRAHGLNSSYALGRADGSYSAARMDLVMSWVVLRDNQQFLEDALADWVALRVLSRAVALGDLQPPPDEDWAARIHWTWPTMPSIDEQKEQSALTLRVKNGVATPQSLLGPAWREIVDQRAEFDAYCRAKGVTLAFQEVTPGATTPAAAEPETGDKAE